MVRWRYCLVLALLVLLPARAISRDDDDVEGSRDEDDEENDDDEDDDDDELSSPSKGGRSPGRRASGTEDLATQRDGLTRTTQKRPIECFVCAYKSETPLRACLDPTKFRVHTVTCHSMDEKCFTQVLSKGSALEAVVRGCRSNCVGSADTTCCELNRCNSQAFAVPVVRAQATPEQISEAQKAVLAEPKKTRPGGHAVSGKTSPPGIPPLLLLFITALLVVQTVVKVLFV